MSALESLIRLYRWQLDERRRHLAALEGLATNLDAEQRRLDGEEAREQATAAASPEAVPADPRYAPRLVERRRTLAQSRGEVAQQIEAARAALAEAFQEVKRHETVVASRARQQRLREERRDQRVLDDLGAEGFRRRRAGQE